MSRLILTCALLAATGVAAATPVVQTPAYRWSGDTVYQGDAVATALSPTEIHSTYHAQPGYYMPVEQTWKLRNDISKYPKLITPSLLHTAVYNMGLDEMVNAVEADTTLRTGKEWAGVWTRDVSYSIILSMAYMQPEASRISLEKKIDPLGRIIQDTGSGGAWPVSTDRQIWTVAAWEVYKATGDRQWLRKAYDVARRSLETDHAAVMDGATGLVHGETSFIDWREQSHPRWMQTADIYQSMTLSTSLVHMQAWEVLSQMASLLGDKTDADLFHTRAEDIKTAVNKHLWMPDKGYYAMYLYGRDHPILNPRAETLGESLAILWGAADRERAVSITEHNPVTPYGPGIFFPQIPDQPAYHNNALWPWVDAYWTMANAQAGNEQGTLEGIGALVRPAALFCTNKENFRLDNGDIATELNSSNMLWCLAGNLAIVHKVLFGIDFKADRLEFAPFVPQALGGTRRLEGFPYRDATLNIEVRGHGAKVASFRVNGKEQKQHSILAAKARGVMDVVIEMDNAPIPPLSVNHTSNLSSPLTPCVWTEGNTLCWNPIEYIGSYLVLRNGETVAETHSTTYEMKLPGEYQVIGVSPEGVQGFASEPRDCRKSTMLQIPGERTLLTSPEVRDEYLPKGAVKGYTGQGFTELDKRSGQITVPFVAEGDGEVWIDVRYANGNGPVNTENSCAIRTLTLDGEPVGMLVMPQRGRANWDDWGFSNSLFIPSLKAGPHKLGITFAPENENMNIHTNHVLVDAIRIKR